MCECVSLVACNNPVPLGMESGDILDAQVTSSSENSNGLYRAKFARLNQKAIADITNGGWSPSSILDSWLQIDFTASTRSLSTLINVKSSFKV